MDSLAPVAKAIDRFNDILGRGVAWLTLTMVLVQFIVVVMRYVFGIGSIFLQESIVYMHGFNFLLGAGYTLLHDGHVRVDIFYRDSPLKRKAVTDLIGIGLFLMPVCLMIFWVSFPYVADSWSNLEGSQETSGIPAVFLLKTSILLFCSVLILQGVSMAIHAGLVLLGAEAPVAEEQHGGLQPMFIKEGLDILMFVAVCGFLMLGFPVAFTLAGTSLLFAGIALLFGVFDTSFLGAMPSRIYGNAMTNTVLLAVPLFVFMGVTLERSKVAEELLDTMGMLFGRLRGGLGLAVCVVGALLAASTGIVGATVVTMGLLSLPTMLRRGYDPKLACGVISASGTLGQIIPPSIVLVVLGDQISNAYVDAQRELGNWSPEPVSVGDLFAGALLPGLLLVAAYMLYTVMVALTRPEAAPAIPREQLSTSTNADVSMLVRVFHALLPPMVLIIAVLGSILAGVATPTEAAGVGAIGALLLAGLRVSEASGMPIYAAAAAMAIMLILTNNLDLRIGLNEITTANLFGIVAAGICCAALAWGVLVSLIRLYKLGILSEVMQATMMINAMVFTIVIGAALFSLIFRALGGDDMVHAFLTSLPGGFVGAMLVVMFTMFILGFFLDFLEITFVVVPIVAPILLQFDINPIWLGVMMAMNLQTSFLTPPFGFALFYLRGVAPETVTTGHIYRGAAPFVIIQVLALGILGFFPEIVNWLPRILFGSFAVQGAFAGGGEMTR